jgi:hypothetical protein
MNMEQLMEWELAWKIEVLGENLPQRHSVHHKSHMSLIAVVNWTTCQEVCVKILEHLNQVGGPWQLVEINE